MAQLSRARLYGLLLLACGGLAECHSWAHDVGEPALQQLPIWSQCCGDGECVSQRLQIIDKAKNKINVEIEGVQTSVDKKNSRLFPRTVPWVCYYRTGGAISNENIRCILYPQQSGTT